MLFHILLALFEGSFFTILDNCQADKNEARLLDDLLGGELVQKQLWKLDDNILINKKGLWKSVDLWNFKTKDDGLIYIENMSKTKVLETTNDNQVILEDFEENKAEQLWQKGNPDEKGYFILVPSLPSSVTVPKVITAISENDLEIKGNIIEIHSQVVYICASLLHLAVESRNLSQAEIKNTVVTF